MYYPEVPPAASLSGMGTQGYLLDALDERVACVFQAPKTGNIRRFYFRTGTITTGGTVDCRLETVDATTGEPSGTLVTANSNVACVIADANDNIWKDSGAFTADAAVTKNDDVAAVIVVPTGFNGNILALETTSGPAALSQYVLHYTSSAWAKQTRGVLLAVEYDDGVVYPIAGVHPWIASNVAALNTGTTPDEAGNKMVVAAPCRAIGVWGVIDLDGLCDVKLYDGDSSVLQTIAIGSDVDIRRSTGPLYFEKLFTTAQSITAGQTLRLVYLPGSATTVTCSEMIYPSAAIMTAVTGRSNHFKCSRTDAGSWVDTATDRMVAIGLIIDQIDDGASAGGGKPRIRVPRVIA